MAKRRRRKGRRSHARRRHHARNPFRRRTHRRRHRRNPGGFAGALTTYGAGFGGGFLANAIGAKAGGTMGNILRLATAIGGGWLVGKMSPNAGAAFASGAFGAIGADMGARMMGGLPAVASTTTKATAVAAMAAEDEAFMQGLGEEFAELRLSGIGGGTELMGDVGDDAGTELMGDRMLDAY